MVDPSIHNDREDDSRGIWILRGVVVLVGLLILANLAQTTGDVIGFFTGDDKPVQASTRTPVEPDPNSIQFANRMAHMDCTTARPSMAEWVGGYVGRVIPGRKAKPGIDGNCSRCGRSL